MNLKDKAFEFMQRYDGSIIEPIHGFIGIASYRIEVNDRIFHIYYAREWYRKYDGISISKDHLLLANKEFAMIVIFINNDEYWKHSTEWIKGKVVENSKFPETEILMRKNQLEKPGIEFPKGLDSF